MVDWAQSTNLMLPSCSCWCQCVVTQPRPSERMKMWMIIIYMEGESNVYEWSSMTAMAAMEDWFY